MIRSLLGFLAALAGLVVLAGPAQGQSADEAAAGRQILVMIKLAPAHYRPGAGYGGAYGDLVAGKSRLRLAQSIARRAGLTIVEGWPMPLIGVDCYVMALPPGVAAATAIAEVSKDPRVGWSEPMHLYRTHGAQRPAGDPLLAIEPAATRWRLADLHRLSTGRGVRVAIVDSKVEVAHPDLSGQFIADENFVSGANSRAEQHGTGVAGIIGAKAGNGIGIAGVAPAARLMALRACWQTPGGPTLCDSLSLAKALQYAIDHGAQVINLSLSGPRAPLLERLLDLALARGAAIVAAYDPDLPGGGFPASLRGVIAVAAEPLQPMPSGLYIAPGRDVPTTQPGGRWYLVNGSSYAAAHVSGLLALARQQRRPGERTVVLARAAGGMVDACATLARAGGACDCCARAAAASPVGDR